MVNSEDAKYLAKGQRLIDMMEYLSMVRKTHISVLAERYGKSRTTIKKDLITLECDYGVPFENKERAYIKVVEGWWFRHKEMEAEDKDAIRYAIRVVDKEEVKIRLRNLM